MKAMYLKFLNENNLSNEYIVRVDRKLSKKVINDIASAILEVSEESEENWTKVIKRVMTEFASHYNFTFETTENAFEIDVTNY